MRAVRWPAVVAVCLLCSTLPAAAETAAATWRSHFGVPWAVSIDPGDRSVWVAHGSSVSHLSSSGALLGESYGFWWPNSVSVDTSDGSCWVADTGNAQVVHLSATGAELWRGGEFREPTSVAANPNDGSCWVADYQGNRVDHLSASGEVLSSESATFLPLSVAVNPNDGSCWVAAYTEVVHLSATGTQLSRGAGYYMPGTVAVNTHDNSCWVADTGSHRLVHLSGTGGKLWESPSYPTFYGPGSLAVNSSDDSVWVSDSGNYQLVHLSSSGSQLWRGGNVGWCQTLAVDESDGSCWAPDYNAGTLSRVSTAGVVLFTAGGFHGPMGVSVDTSDGSCWATDTDHGQVVHLSAAGAELWRGGALNGPTAVSANPTDHSCWVADTGHNQVVHLSSSGVELSRTPGYPTFWAPRALAVNTHDGSCWVVDTENDEVVHLSATGEELVRVGGLSNPHSLGVDPVNDTCWVTDTGNSQIVQLSPTGAELWRSPGYPTYNSPTYLAVNPSDGSVWVREGTLELVHISAAWIELWRGGTFVGSGPLAVNSADGSCWTSDRGNPSTWRGTYSAVAHFSASGEELWRGGGADQPFGLSVDPTTGACWVADTYNNQIARLEILAPPEAAFTADVTVGTAPLTVEFSDLSSHAPTAWAWDFGDTATADARNPSHTYAAGTYTVALAVTNAAGSDTETKADYLQVTIAAPVADFTGLPTSGTAPLVVAFTDASTGAPTSWSWSFGDAGTSTLQSPVHTYGVGTFTVSLTVTNAGGSDTESKTGYIAAVVGVQPPAADFTAAPLTGVIPLAVTFTDASTNAPTAWSWTFGDGATATVQHPGHTYSAAGSYTVALTVSNAAGSDTETKTGYLAALAPAPAADFTATPTAGPVPLAVAFTDASSNAPTAWAWTFGDGGTATAQHPGHTYTAAGSYAVSLTASNAGGSDTETKTGYITATVPPPTADFSADPVSGTAPLAVAFTDTSTGTPTAWTWDFGDGGTSTEASPTHTYTESGLYTVTLLVTNAGGSDTAVKEQYITVTFADVGEGFWAQEAILACVEAGIVAGYADDTYRPTSPVTRDQMAVYVSRALAGGDAKVPTAPAVASFTDVGTEHWAFRYVEYAEDRRIVTGYSDNTYRPTVEVTRDQMAVYISRAVVDPTGDEGLASYTPPTTASFADVPASHWAFRYIEYAKSQDIVKGYSDGYRPAVVVTRDQMAVYVARAFDLLP